MKNQIEEMACEKCLHFEACQIAFRNSKSLEIYDCTEEEYFNSTLDCDYYINNKDYRKADEVAREILEKFENNIKFHISLVDSTIFAREEIREEKLKCYRDILGYLAELKKEYIGEDINDRTNTEES